MTEWNVNSNHQGRWSPPGAPATNIEISEVLVELSIWSFPTFLNLHFSSKKKRKKRKTDAQVRKGDYQWGVVRHLAENKGCALAYSDISLPVVRVCPLSANLEIMEALYINPLWSHWQEYKIVKNAILHERIILSEKKKHFWLLQPFLVWKILSNWSRNTNPKVRGTLKSLRKIVTKRSHQEECVHSAKTAKCVVSCVASQVLQVTDKLLSFPSKAEFSQI